MMKSIESGSISWINIDNPSANDILFLKDTFRFDPLLLEEITCPSQRPRAEEFENCLYVVMHIPLFNRKTRVTTSGELDIIITANHLITAHSGENIPLKALLKEFRENDSLRKQAMSKSTGYLLYFILEKLLSSCLPKIDHINEQVSRIEQGIFEDNNKTMVWEASIVKRDILAFRRTLKPQRSILESLSQKRYRLIEPELNKYFQDLIGTNIRVWNALENTKEVIASLEETNNTLVAFKLSETMRFLSAISFITFALSVTTGVFSVQPFAVHQAAKEPATFWLVILFMALVTLSLILFFRKKNWL